MAHFRLPALAVLALLAAPAVADSQPPDEMERVFLRLYNFDFPGAHAILDSYIAGHPADPLPYAVRSAVYVYSELDRMGILESEFFADDKRITEKKKLKPDPAVRTRFFQAVQDTQSRAQPILTATPDDFRATFATCLAVGVVMDYTALIEKRHLSSLSDAKRGNLCAQHLLKVHPQAYDAYVTTGFTEYLVGSLAFYVRWFVHFDDVKGSKEQGIKNLRLAAQSGHYLKPFAKVLLAMVYLRENEPEQSFRFLSDLSHDYPENPLFRKELAKVAARLPGISAASSSAP